MGLPEEVPPPAVCKRLQEASLKAFFFFFAYTGRSSSGLYPGITLFTGLGPQAKIWGRQDNVVRADG